MPGAEDDRFEFMGQANETSGRFHFKAEQFTFGDRVLKRASLVRGLLSSARRRRSIRRCRERRRPHAVASRRLAVKPTSISLKFMQIDSDLALSSVEYESAGASTMDVPITWCSVERMLFDASQTLARDSVATKSADSDMGPRKSAWSALSGPGQRRRRRRRYERWMGQIDAKVDYSNNASAFDVSRDIDGVDGGANSKSRRRSPTLLGAQHRRKLAQRGSSPREGLHLHRGRYFRAPMLGDAIVERTGNCRA